MADKNTKEQILDSLEGKLIVTKVEEDFEEGVAIICEFIRNGDKGIFRYFWDNDGWGIDYVEDFEGENIDCVEGEIHEWANKHFKYKSSVSLKHDGKELLN